METSRKLASYLLQSKAIIIDPATPFTWASGWSSPIYCDNRKTLSYPVIRSFIRDAFIELIRNNFKSPDIIAGVATGAIAHAALVAESLDLPMLYIRSEQKSHGLGTRIEGDLNAGKRAVVVEDLVSTGNSSLRAVSALQEAGFDVLGMTAIFTYDFPVAVENFDKAGIPLLTIGNYTDLIEVAAGNSYIRPEEMETLKTWREDPAGWRTR
jgi:orotate phosphoribosyltransferase